MIIEQYTPDDFGNYRYRLVWVDEDSIDKNSMTAARAWMLATRTGRHEVLDFWSMEAEYSHMADGLRWRHSRTKQFAMSAQTSDFERRHGIDRLSLGDLMIYERMVKSAKRALGRKPFTRKVKL